MRERDPRDDRAEEKNGEEEAEFHGREGRQRADESPDYFDGISFQEIVGADDRNGERERSRNQQPIEWVVMVLRQIDGREKSIITDWLVSEFRLPDPFTKIRRGAFRERQFADLIF